MSLLTEKALAASLKKMLERKTLDKITVKDITDDCGVNRQTFYYHFHDIYDLVEWIFTEEGKHYLAGNIDEGSWRENIKKMMDRLIEDKAFVMNTFFSINRRQLEQFLQKMVRPSIEKLVKHYSEGKHVSDEDIEFVISIYTFGLIGIIAEWVASGMSAESTKLLDKFFAIMDGSLDYTLNKLALL